jgi:hypothetical protein
VLVAATGAVQALRLLVGDGWRASPTNDVQAFFVSTALVLLLGTLIEASREFDHSTEMAYAGASRRSAEEARGEVRRRLQAVVHDELLAVLVLAAQDAPALRPAVAAQATRARRLLDDLHEPDAEGYVTVERLPRELRAVVAREAPDARQELGDARAGGAGAVPGVGGLERRRCGPRSWQRFGPRPSARPRRTCSESGRGRWRTSSAGYSSASGPVPP